MTLNTPSVEVTVDHSDELQIESFNADRSIHDLNDKDIARFEKHLQLTKNYLSYLDAKDSIPGSISITIHSGIPPSVGLASSAAVFSAMAKAYAGLIAGSIELSNEQISVIARMGSGSATRSIFGGFVTLENIEGDSIGSAVAKQIASEDHWKLHDIVVIPSKKEKKVGSTDGHAIANTSPHFEKRVEAINSHRQQDCIDAILQKDFEKLQKVSEEDSLDMHHVMETSEPPLTYLTEDTHRIIDDIAKLRESEHLPVLYTMDAGPTVHLVCAEEAKARIVKFAHAQEGCTIFEATVGPGSHFV